MENQPFDYAASRCGTGDRSAHGRRVEDLVTSDRDAEKPRRADDPHVLDQSVETFRETYGAISRVYDLYARGCGVSPTEFWCIAALAENDLTNQAQVADRLGASRQTVNSAFKQLVSRGLVTLDSDPDNGRVKRARLTDKGRVFVDRHLVFLERAEEQVWESLPAEDRAAVNRAMAAFLDRLAPALERGEADVPE